MQRNGMAGATQLSLHLQAAPVPQVPTDALLIEGVPVPLRFVRHPRARRYVLRLSREGHAVVTIPRCGNRREARRFAERHDAWLARERRALMAARSRARPLAIGDTVIIAGRPHVIVGADERTHALRIASAVVPLRGATVHDAVVRWLRDLARTMLATRLDQLAVRHGLVVAGISVRNQRTRWGSCSPDGRISLNWRLVQMPDAVRDYVLLHELMHLRVRHHSRRFWREVERVCPDYADARRWLRDHSGTLL
jgi:predicted metal-dependent hydrolase